MKYCPLCRQNYSDNVSHCPRCGYDFLTPNDMKPNDFKVYWQRAEIKTEAKSTLSYIIGKAIFVCFIVSLISIFGLTIQRNLFSETYNVIMNIHWLKFYIITGLTADEFFPYFFRCSAVAILLGIFLYSPYLVGINRFFMKAINGEASLNNAFFPFQGKNYLKVLVRTFLYSLKLFLWTLLLIIPGIIRYYEYYMVPFIISENPGISDNELYSLSRNMTEGHKWNLFVLDLSFILWMLLSYATLGLAGIVWVFPYIHATKAHLYQKFRLFFLSNNLTTSAILPGFNSAEGYADIT